MPLPVTSLTCKLAAMRARLPHAPSCMTYWLNAALPLI